MTTTSHSEPLLSVPKFASRVGVSPYTVRKWIKAGAIRAFDINLGGKLPVYRIPEGQLENIIERSSLPTAEGFESDPAASGGTGDGVSGGVPDPDGPVEAGDRTEDGLDGAGV
jgi:hypothetical protein